ncbi:hypothetical protein [Flammeovirga pacifica]|uniref:Uncharacterized protein n=1 Tax=Flammeovirga pacifica TaxID=915059 RepID=A0A1S1Z204_FLAPC|nr:hypothetical protein [Flammeovirga pacifica]OHX67304.1 hypothetical protein NH26_13605 [Flammeovirga pacifica]
MKKSNILLISILSSVTLFIISGAIVSVAKGKPEVNNNSFSISTPTFNHVLMNKTNYSVNAKTGEKYELVVWLEKGEEKINLPFITKGDTLILSPISEELSSKIRFVEMTIPAEEMEFELKDAQIDFNNYSNKELKIKLDQSSVNMYSYNDNYISKLDISIKNKSDFYSNTSLDHLNLSITNSSFTNQASIKEVIGEASDSSKVYIESPGLTNLKKDASSKVRFEY